MKEDKYNVSVIILVWNDYDNTINCLNSLKKINYKNLDVIVVDNNSADGSCKKLEKEFSNVTFIYNQENFGYAGGNNVGITYALNNGADYFFVINNDVIIDSKDIIDRMLDYFIKIPDLGILGPKLMQLAVTGDFFEVNYRSGYYEFIRRFLLKKPVVETSYKDFKTIAFRTVVSGCALMIKREVIEKVGAFNEDFFMFVEENDLCLRTIKAGFLVGQSLHDDTIVRHLGGISYKKNDSWKYFLLNRNKFLEFRSFEINQKVMLFLIHILGMIKRHFKWLLKGEIKYIKSSFLGTIFGIRIWYRDSLSLSKPGEYLKEGRDVASGKHRIANWIK